MIPCIICKTRPAGIHLNTGQYKKHLWVCDECSPIQTKTPEVKYAYQKWIRILRLDHGISYRPLMKGTGIDVVKLNHYENGYVLIPREDEIKILQFFISDHPIDKAKAQDLSIDQRES